MSTTPQATQANKRQRVPQSCVICRRRKIKCDRAKPHCSRCIKSKSQNLCVYKESIWIDSTKSFNIETAAMAQPQPVARESAEVSFSRPAFSNFSVGTVSGSGAGAATNGSPGAGTGSTDTAASATTAGAGTGAGVGAGANVNADAAAAANANANAVAGAGAGAATQNGKFTGQFSAAGYKPAAPMVSDLSNSVAPTPMSLAFLGRTNSSHSSQSPIAHANGNTSTSTRTNGNGNGNLNASTSANGSRIHGANTTSGSTTGGTAHNSVSQFSPMLSGTQIPPLDAPLYDYSDHNARDNIVDKEISMLKDRLERLQASLYIKGLSKTKSQPSPHPQPQHHQQQQQQTPGRSDYGYPYTSDPGSVGPYNSGHTMSSVQQQQQQQQQPPVSAQMRMSAANGAMDMHRMGDNGENYRGASTSLDPFSYDFMGEKSNIDVAAPDQNLFDNLLKYFQKEGFIGLKKNGEPEYQYNVPHSVLANFSFEEHETLIDAQSSGYSGKKVNFEDFTFLRDKNNSSFVVTLSLVWYAYENDCFVKTIGHLNGFDSEKFAIDFHQTVVDKDISRSKGCYLYIPEFFNPKMDRFLCSSKAQGSRLTAADLALYILCTSNYSSDQIILPLTLAVPEFFSFNPISGSLVLRSISELNSVELRFAIAIIKRVREIFSSVKLLMFLLARFFKSYMFTFSFLDKESIIENLAEIDYVLFGTLDSDECFHAIFKKSSPGFILDLMGLIMLITKITYVSIVASLHECFYANNFNADALSDCDLFILDCAPMDFKDFFNLAKACYSFKLNFHSIYENFNKIEHAILKTQLGLLLLHYDVEWSSHLDCPKSIASCVFDTIMDRSKSDSVGRNGAFSKEDIFARTLPAYENMSDVEFEALDNDKYFNAFMQDTSLPRGDVDSTDSDQRFSATQKSEKMDRLVNLFFLYRLQGMMSEFSSSFSTLVKFSEALKLNEDPLNYFDLSMSIHRLPNSKKDRSLAKTLALIKEWRLTWLEIVFFDKELSVITGLKPALQDDAYEEKFRRMLDNNDKLLMESADEKIRVSYFVKRNKVNKFMWDPILKLNKKLKNQSTPVKLKDYLSVISSIEDFIHFQNDYKPNEVFDLIDRFRDQYPLFFENPVNFDSNMASEYNELEYKSIHKNFHAINSLLWYIKASGDQFSILYTLFALFDNSICFGRNKGGLSIFKKLLFSLSTLVRDVLRVLKNIVDVPHYRKFIFVNYKVCIMTQIHKLLFAMFVFEFSLSVRFMQAIKLNQEYIRQKPDLAGDSGEKAQLFLKFLHRVIAANDEILRIAKSLYNFSYIPSSSTLSVKDQKILEKLNAHYAANDDFFSSQVVCLMTMLNSFCNKLNMDKVDDVFETDCPTEAMDWFELAVVKFRKFSTVDGKELVLPNFSSFLHLSNSDLEYMLEEFMSDFAPKSG